MLITVAVRQVTVPILVLGSFLVVLSPVLVNTMAADRPIDNLCPPHNPKM